MSGISSPLLRERASKQGKLLFVLASLPAAVSAPNIALPGKKKKMTWHRELSSPHPPDKDIEISVTWPRELGQEEKAGRSWKRSKPQQVWTG